MNRYLLSNTDKGFTFVWGNGESRSGAEVFFYESSTNITCSKGYQTLEKFPTEIIRRMMRGGDLMACPDRTLMVAVTTGTEREGQEVWREEGGIFKCSGYYFYDRSKAPIL